MAENAPPADPADSAVEGQPPGGGAPVEPAPPDTGAGEQAEKTPEHHAAMLRLMTQAIESSSKLSERVVQILEKKTADETSPAAAELDVETFMTKTWQEGVVSSRNYASGTFHGDNLKFQRGESGCRPTLAAQDGPVISSPQGCDSALVAWEGASHSLLSNKWTCRY